MLLSAHARERGGQTEPLKLREKPNRYSFTRSLAADSDGRKSIRSEHGFLALLSTLYCSLLPHLLPFLIPPPICLKSDLLSGMSS
jgi:hypothetical protein